jgi:hypothetical protein
MITKENSSNPYSTALQSQADSDATSFHASRRLLLIATVVTLALWFVPYSNYLLYPLRLFVTFVHESGHALTALASGGSVASVTIHPDGSGVTMTRDSTLWGWLVLSGGYLGTTLFGALMLQVGRLNRWREAGRVTLYAVAVALLAITLLWGWHDAFTLVSGLGLTALLWAVARFTSPRGANFAASFLAVQCCLNALFDLRILLYITTNNGGDTDAKFMSQQYGLPPTFWALVWAGMALAILFVALSGYWRATDPRAARRV